MSGIADPEHGPRTFADANPGFGQGALRRRVRLVAAPGMVHAGIYSATTHYLNAVKAAGTDETVAVRAQMAKTPVNDMFAKDGRIREDGRMVHDMYLVQVKTPAESTGEWDLYKIVSTIPGEQAYRPIAETQCTKLVAKD